MDHIVEYTEKGERVTIPLSFSHYKYVSTFGKGGTGVIVSCLDTKTGQIRAAKVTSRQMIIETNQMEYLERELRVSTTFNHPNIIKVYEEIYLPDVIIIVMDLCENGDLLSYLSENPFIVSSNAKRLFRQLVDAVSYLHDRNIVHRDLKPENIFLDSDLNVQLGDFGLAKDVKKNGLLETICGTLYYLPPEIIMEKGYDGKKSDVWSLGVILYIMIFGTIPWKGKNQIEILNEICSGNISVPETISPLIEEVIKKCLNVDPEQRPTAKQILEMPWLKTNKAVHIVSPHRNSVPVATLSRYNFNSAFNANYVNNMRRNINSHISTGNCVRSLDTIREQFLGKNYAQQNNIFQSREQFQKKLITKPIRIVNSEKRQAGTYFLNV